MNHWPILNKFGTYITYLGKGDSSLFNRRTIPRHLQRVDDEDHEILAVRFTNHLIKNHYTNCNRA